MTDVHVKLRVGRETYAVPVANVVEVADLGDVTAVPGAPADVLGVRNFHGQVLTVFDLARVLGISNGGRAPRVLVTDRRGTLAGLAVDEVTEVGPLGSHAQETESELLTHAVLDDESLVGVIDLDRLYGALGATLS